MCLADGLADYTHVDLEKRTFYERVHPNVNELDFVVPQATEKANPITLGMVRFGLKYDFNEEIFEVTIFEAKNLPAADEGIKILLRQTIAFTFLNDFSFVVFLKVRSSFTFFF